MSSASSDTPVPSYRAPATEPLCPFHDGAATLDLLLAELNPHETRLFDAVLDLRTIATAGTDAEACVAQLYQVRRLLAGRHYLAFYRVRCWARRALRVEVRATRSADWVPHPLPLNSARVDEVVNTALATLASGPVPFSGAHVRFRFA